MTKTMAKRNVGREILEGLRELKRCRIGAGDALTFGRHLVGGPVTFNVRPLWK